MTLRFGLLALAGLWIIEAQTAPGYVLEDPSVLRAKINVEKIRTMVESGTLPRIRLEKALSDLEDVQDESQITRALFGKDLTSEQAAQTVTVAQRRVDRRKKTVADQQTLLAQGIISQSEMKTATDDLERVTKQLEWAVTREKLVAEIAVYAAAEVALMKQMEEGAPMPGEKIERYGGKGDFTTADFTKVQTAYSARFAKPIPISANGETAVHQSMGFDHRNRIDVAIYPDSEEGRWLRHFLIVNRMPFFAFRGPVAHQATGAHIHLGPPSTRFVPTHVGAAHVGMISTGGN